MTASVGRIECVRAYDTYLRGRVLAQVAIIFKRVIRREKRREDSVIDRAVATLPVEFTRAEQRNNNHTRAKAAIASTTAT